MSKLHLQCWLLTLRLLASIAHGVFRLRYTMSYDKEGNMERAYMQEQDKELQAETELLLVKLEREADANDVQTDQ